MIWERSLGAKYWVVTIFTADSALSLSSLALWLTSGSSFLHKALFYPAPSERSEQMSRLCFSCSSLKTVGTIFTETFLMFKFSFRMWASVCWSKFNSSAIILTDNHGFESAKSVTFSTFPLVLYVIAWPFFTWDTRAASCASFIKEVRWSQRGLMWP